MAIGTVQPGLIKTGPGRIYYAPMGTAIPSFTAASSKVSGTWTNWIEVGATDEGLTYNESADTSSINVAESKYPVRTEVTSKEGRVTFSMAHVSDLNWQLAMNGGTITVSGTGATKLSVYTPPLIGAEVRVMLGFQSKDDDEVLVWPQVFNVGSVETSRSAFDAKHLLPVEFAVELPDPAVMPAPYRRWTSGDLAQATGV